MASRKEVTLPPDVQIKADLVSCMDAELLIPSEQEKIKRQIDAETNIVKRDYLWWYHDFVSLYLQRAADAAKTRLAHLEGLTSIALREEENEKCANDPVHYCRYWAWSLDPRMSVLPVVPFYPFKYQEDDIEWLVKLITVEQTDGVWDKSRDMGASWVAVHLSVWFWRYRSYFQCLFGSYKEELVDSKEEPDTLLEKCRFQLRRMPTWMLPHGFDIKQHAGYMKIVNPETGALIAGAAPTQNFGRAGRYSVIWFDEHAAWPFGGYAQWTASSQSSRSKISFSTPQGKLTKQAQLRFGGSIPHHSSHWKRHPWKDERWYAGQALSMTAEDIAQELDIDYEASQPGRILTMFDEVLNVITWSEFERVYNQRQIPNNWLLGRCQDVGTTEEHLNVTSWTAKPRKDALWNDSVFFYRELVPPLDWPVEWIGEGKRDDRGNVIEQGIQQLESPRKEAERMVISLLSHEAKSEQRTYQYTCKRYPIRFGLIQKPDANGGISEMRALMAPIPDEPNPFVVYPEGHPDEGQPIMGRPRLYLVVDDDQGKLMWDGERLYRQEARDARGHARARFEIPLYHYPASEKDKPVKMRKPFKRNDDWIDTARYQCRVWGPPAADKSKSEKFEESLPQDVRLENAPKVEVGHVLTPKEQEEFSQYWLNRQIQIDEKNRESKKATHWRKRKKR